MKKFLHLGLAIYGLVLICLLVLANYFIVKFSNKTAPTSPLPESLTYFKNDQVSSLNLWLPVIKLSSTAFEITAESALVYDLTTSEILYSKNPNTKLPMASLTKIMTAVIALENKKSDDRYFVHKEDLVGENTMGLESGEILNLEELLYGLMLNSGNDSAEVLASNFNGGRASFIDAMNRKSKALGIKDTNFTNPTGLEGDGNQYTTAFDMLVISKYAASKFPELMEITSNFNYNIPATATHKAFYLENETNLISSYPGVKGIKNGYTPEAGLCLVTYLEYQGHKIIAILLNSNNRRQEMKDLLDFSLKSQGVKPPPHI